MINFPSKYKADAEKSTGFLFMRTYNKWHSRIKTELKTIGITHPQFVVISAVGYLMQYEQEITQVMIANKAGMDVMSISQIVGLLEKNGILSRKEHSRDTRAKAIALTSKGREKMEAAMPVVEGIDSEFFGMLGQDEQDFLRFLNQLNRQD